MSRRIAITAGIGTVAIVAALTLGGISSIGRLALSLGMPSLATELLTDDAWRGVALYQAEDFAGAAEAFASDEAGSRYNEGNARARNGEYGAALVAYESVMATEPDSIDALTNHAIVSQIYAGTRFENPAIPMQLKDREGAPVPANIGQGGARAQGTGSEANNTGAGFEMPELFGSGVREVPRIFDEKYLVASERWLATLEDQPGQYLKARIDAERKRRAKLAKGEQ